MLKRLFVSKILYITLLLGIMNIFSSLQAAVQPELFDKKECEKTAQVNIHCGKTPSATFDKQGRLWVVFEFKDHLYVSYSDDQGKNYSSSKMVNQHPEVIYTNGENRPKIIMGLKDEIYLSWTKKTEGRFTGDIRFSRSLDSGVTFTPPTTINDDGVITGHRFDSMTVSRDGTIFIAWIDKRDNQKQKNKSPDAKPNRKKQNGAIYTSFSVDSGKTFSKNKKLAENSCVCCRIAITPTTENSVAISWRHVYEGSIRDHAFAIINTKGTQLMPTRVSKDNWQIDACPHHGPSIIEDKYKKLHLVWFTASEKRKGIFYGRLNSTNSQADNLVNLSNQPSASHPYIISNEKMLLAVWKEFNRNTTQIKQVVSTDFGKNWSEPAVVTETAGESDHPLLLTNKNKFWLSWSTEQEGLRIIILAPANHAT